MLSPQSRPLVHKLAILGKDHYTISTIGDLFVLAGADRTWVGEPDDSHASQRMAAFYGWINGISSAAPDELHRVIKVVAVQVADNRDVPEGDRAFLRRQLESLRTERTERSNMSKSDQGVSYLDKVLVALDELGGTARDDHKLKVPGYSRDQLLQYLDTLYEEGMVKATQRISTFKGLSFLGISITTKGLDRIRKLTGSRRQADGGEEKMRVFLSWSGDASHALAEALHGWLPTALPFVDPWMSSKDLAKGTRQDEELAKKLDRTGHSIACVTPGVQGSPWVNFEAGAISKLVGESHVYPLLLGVSVEDLRDLPLGRFQCTDAKKQEDVLRLLRSINAQHASPIPNEKLRRDMSNLWPALRDKIKGIERSQAGTRDPEEVPWTSTADYEIDQALSIVISMSHHAGVIQQQKMKDWVKTARKHEMPAEQILRETQAKFPAVFREV